MELSSWDWKSITKEVRMHKSENETLFYIHGSFKLKRKKLEESIKCRTWQMCLPDELLEKCAKSHQRPLSRFSHQFLYKYSQEKNWAFDLFLTYFHFGTNFSFFYRTFFCFFLLSSIRSPSFFFLFP